MTAAAYDATKHLFENKVAKPITEGKIRGNMKGPGPGPVKPPPAPKPKPKPIKIEQISRETAFVRCDYCHRRELHMHYYVMAKTKKFKTFGDCLIHTRKTMVEFVDRADPQDFHSFCGGKIRENFLSPDNVRHNANAAWEKDNYKLTAERISCYDLMDDNVTEIVTDENFKGFIKT